METSQKQQVHKSAAESQPNNQTNIQPEIYNQPQMMRPPYAIIYSNADPYKNLTQPPLLPPDNYPQTTWNRPPNPQDNNLYYPYPQQFINQNTQQYYSYPHMNMPLPTHGVPGSGQGSRDNEQSITAQKQRQMVISQPTMMPQHYQINQGFNPQKINQPPIYSNYPPQNIYYQYPNNVPPNVQPSSEGEDDWQKKFYFIYERFEEQYQRFDELRQLKTVDSQQDWNELKAHHQDLFIKFNQMQQQLQSVLVKVQEMVEGKNTDYQQIWQIRYYELLSNYKALEDQHNQLKQSQNYPSDLVNQYHQLEVEYSNALNELKEYKERDSSTSQINDYKEKLQYALEEGQRYKSILDKLHQDNEELHNYIQQLQEQNNKYQKQYSRNKIDKSQYEELLGVLSEKEEMLGEVRMQNEFTVRENKKLQSQIQTKNRQIIILRQSITKNKSQPIKSQTVAEEYNKIIKNKTDEIAQYRNMLKLAEDQYKTSIRDYQETITKQYEEKINALKRENKRLQNRLAQAQSTQIKPIPTIHKLQSYQKKIAYYEQQVITLNETLTKRNQQLLQLRGMAYEVDKAKNIQNQFQTLTQQNNQLKEIIKTKTKQIDAIKSQLYQYESKLRQPNKNKDKMNNKSLSTELQSLTQSISKKDSQLTKFKQIIQAKQQQLLQAQQECEKIKVNAATMEKSFQVQKEAYQSKIKKLEQCNNEKDKKLRHLQFQYGDTMKNNLKTQINSLRAQNHLKQQTITKLESQQIQLQTIISNLERQKRDADYDENQLLFKISQFEKWKTDYSKQMSQISLNLQTRDRQIKDMRLHQITLKGQFNSFKKQVSDLQGTLRTKNNIIKQLEDQTQFLSKELTESTKQLQQIKTKFKNLQKQSCSQILAITEKLNQAESLNHSKSRGRLDNELNNQLNIINFFKSENQRLKIELAKSFQRQTPVKPKGGEGLKYIQKRLSEFNSKLQDLIVQNPSSPNNSPTKTKTPESLSNSKAQFNQDDFKNLKENLFIFKDIVQVQRQDQVMMRHSQIFLKQQAEHKREIQFYKQKGEQFQGRVDYLLKVNQQLKSRLQSLLKINNEFSPINFYKEQANLAEKNIQGVTQRLKKLSEQNRQLKQQLIEINSQNNIEKDQRIEQLQNQIQQLNRKIRTLQLQKTALHNEKTNLLHKLSKQQTDFNIIHALLQQKLINYENHADQLFNKCNSYQIQLKMVNDRIRTLEDDKIRLSRKVNDYEQKGFLSVKSYNKMDSPPQSPKYLNKNAQITSLGIMIQLFIYLISLLIQRSKAFIKIYLKIASYSIFDNVQKANKVLHLQKKINYQQLSQYIFYSTKIGLIKKKYYVIKYFLLDEEILNIKKFQLYNQLQKKKITQIYK